MLTKLAGAITAGLLVGGLTVAAPAATAQPPAPAGADPAPAAAAARWLVGQVPASGLLHIYSDFGGTVYESDDVGLTIDGATSLAEVDGDAATIARMTAGVESGLPDYYASFGTTYANAAAKATAFLLARGRTGPAVDDAKAALAGTVSTTAPIAGRVEDLNGFNGADYATPLGQAYAVQALDLAGDDALRDSALGFLLAQQCAGGWIRGSFTADKAAADQSCAGAPAAEQTSSVDTTAFTILNLQDLAASKPEIATALDRAASWLASAQAADGSFTTEGTAGAPVNANSTGLAARALAVEGKSGAAAKAARWLRAHQLANAGACKPYAAADNGALVVDDLGLANAGSGPMDNIDRSVALRATAQALPALAYTPGGPRSGATSLDGPKGYVADASRQRIAIVGAPNNTLCVKAGKKPAALVVLGANGRASVSVKLPRGRKNTTVTVVDAAGRKARTTIKALGPVKLRVAAPATVKRGTKAAVKVTRLAAGERVKIKLGGKVVAKGKANARGVFKARVKVKATPGKAKLVVVGQFPDRKGSTTITIRR